jgi:hypothetical protein
MALAIRLIHELQLEVVGWINCDESVKLLREHGAK